MKITVGTIARTVILALALFNQVMVSTGKSPLPIEDADIEMLFTLGFNIVASVIAFWKNNSYTQKAIKADVFMKNQNM